MRTKSDYYFFRRRYVRLNGFHVYTTVFLFLFRSSSSAPRALPPPSPLLYLSLFRFFPSCLFFVNVECVECFAENESQPVRRTLPTRRIFLRITRFDVAVRRGMRNSRLAEYRHAEMKINFYRAAKENPPAPRRTDNFFSFLVQHDLGAWYADDAVCVDNSAVRATNSRVLSTCVAELPGARARARGGGAAQKRSGAAARSSRFIGSPSTLSTNLGNAM